MDRDHNLPDIVLLQLQSAMITLMNECAEMVFTGP